VLWAIGWTWVADLGIAIAVFKTLLIITTFINNHQKTIIHPQINFFIKLAMRILFIINKKIWK